MKLIEKTFYKLLIPSLLMVFAVSISEFVDAMIVAHLLGSTAMAIVNLANPIMLLSSAIGTLIACGGSVIYTNEIGSHRQDEASRTYSLSIVVSIVLILLVSAVLMISFNAVHSFLCNDDPQLMALSSDYIKVLILSIPIITVVNVIIMFLPSAGNMNMGAALIILANVVNLAMDIVFIKVFNMGVPGAAIATLTGYTVSLVIFFILRALGKINLKAAGIGFSDLRKKIASIFSMGSSSALTQLSFAIKFAFCNAAALRFGGKEGLVALTVCLQLLSIASIFVGGISSSMLRTTAFLKGQNDYASIRTIGKKSYILQLVCSLVLMVLFFSFPQSVASMFNVTHPEEMKLTAGALRIFSLCLVFRGLYVTFMFYVQALGKSLYASVISLSDGFVLVIPVVLVLCHFMGLDGLWWSFPVVSVLLFVSIILWNVHLTGRHPDKYSGIILSELDTEAQELLNWSGTVTSCNVGEVCLAIPDESFRETVNEYFTEILRNGGSGKVKAEILYRRCGERTVVELRSDGGEACPSQLQSTDNLSIKKDFSLGMNTLQILSVH